MHAFHELRCVVERELVVAVPRRDRSRHLDRVMRFGGRSVDLLDFRQAGALQWKIDISFFDLHRAKTSLRFRRAALCCVHRQQRLLRRVAHFD